MHSEGSLPASGRNPTPQPNDSSSQNKRRCPRFYDLEECIAHVVEERKNHEQSLLREPTTKVDVIDPMGWGRRAPLHPTQTVMLESLERLQSIQHMLTKQAARRSETVGAFVAFERDNDYEATLAWDAKFTATSAAKPTDSEKINQKREQCERVFPRLKQPA